MKCENIKDKRVSTAKNKKNWVAIRCRNEATRKVTVHQQSDHPKVGNGWFVVHLCEKCLWGSDSSAIVDSVHIYNNLILNKKK